MKPPSTADLLLHPVRLRLVNALLGGREMTTAELDAELPDVSTATVYRQVAVLSDAGVLVVVDERKVRAVVQRTYALHLPGAQVSDDELSAMSREDHRRGFMAFVATLLAEFDHYLAHADVDLARDGAGYRQTALWLSDDELATLLDQIRSAVAQQAGNEPSASRRRRTLATTLIPT